QNKKTQKLIAERLDPFPLKDWEYEVTTSDDFYQIKNHYAYAKLYKNGRLEIVRASYSSGGSQSNSADSGSDIKFIPVDYERDMKVAIEASLDLLKTLKINPPLFGTLTLLEANGYKLRKKSKPYFNYPTKEIRVEGNDIEGNEFVISDYESAGEYLDTYLEPMFTYVRKIVDWG
ncbi:MAG: hypothetical protein ABWZ66_04925, partial [Pyrinomonadaceae bacterium]